MRTIGRRTVWVTAFRTLPFSCLLALLLVVVAATNVRAELCPQAVRFEVDGATSDIDLGFTGIAHDFFMPDSTLTMRAACKGSGFPACGDCTLSGPIPNAAGYNRRCLGDTSIICNDDSACGASVPCTLFFGPPMPVPVGGIGVCLTTEVPPALPTVPRGSFNAGTGVFAPELPLRWRIYLDGSLSAPCPQCVSDPVLNDGTRDGTCSGGAHSGSRCDGNGASPITAFGSTSFDCPPTFSSSIGSLLPEAPVPFSSAGRSLTLSAASPNCTGAGVTSAKCACQSCATAQLEACQTDADCPTGRTCGGRRCLPGSTNVGVPCTVTGSGAPECGGGLCGVPGQPTRPNSCDDGVCTPTVNGEGVCAAGPFNSYCAAPEQYLPCGSNGNCPLTNNCVLRWRECFTDNGVMGGSITAPGITTVPVANTASPTLGGVACVAPTSASSANSVGGFPGATRITLPGTLTLAQEIESRLAAPNDPVTTGPTASAQDPVETTVTSPNGGLVAIVEQNVTGTPPPVGYTFVKQQVSITAPAATAGTPIVITFRLDNSRLPGVPTDTCGVRRTGIILQRNGDDVTTVCSGGGASPSPCLVGIVCLNGDSALSSDVEITVRTAAASIWRIAVLEEVVTLVPVAGKKLQIKDSADPTKRKLTLQLADPNIETPAPSGVDDPTCAGLGGGGATLQIFGAAGTGKVVDTYLPCARWKRIGDPLAAKGYKYTDAKTVDGPCKTVLLKNRKPGSAGFKDGQLKAVCGSKTALIDYDLDIGEGSIGVRLRTGAGAGLCAEFGGIVSRDDATLFAAKDATAPGGCPPLP